MNVDNTTDYDKVAQLLRDRNEQISDLTAANKRQAAKIRSLREIVDKLSTKENEENSE